MVKAAGRRLEVGSTGAIAEAAIAVAGGAVGRLLARGRGVKSVAWVSLVPECFHDGDTGGGAGGEEGHEGACAVGDGDDEDELEPGDLELDVGAFGEGGVGEEVVRESGAHERRR